jgi:hypothetical protein
MGRALGILVLTSVALFAALTAWTNHTTAATHEHSHEFTQNAKTICQHAKHTVPGVENAAAQLEALSEPPNVHRAVARLVLAWRSGATPKQVRLAAHLLGVTACESVVPR